jgi:hypothetical protein
MNQQQVYFVHARVTERGENAAQRFDREFLVTSKDDAKEQMRRYIDGQLPACVWNWRILVFTKEEEETFRSFTKEMPTQPSDCDEQGNFSGECPNALSSSWPFPA